MVAWLELIKCLVIGFTASVGFSTLTNIVGSITGQNPLAQATGTLLQNILPIIITLMPIMFIMSMFMSMMQDIMAPFTALTRIMTPTVTTY
jgi:uncharacterized BrkB/YihY/UPF0761 family membrane protein